MSTNEIDFLSILVSFAEKTDNDTNKNKQDPVVYMAENPKTQEYYFVHDAQSLLKPLKNDQPRYAFSAHAI